jgi:outer membrane protein TolC
MRTLFLALVSVVSCLNVEAQTLSELYEMAETQSESLGSKAALVEQANVRYYQALGSIFPSASLEFSQTKQDQIANGLAGTITNFKITGTQPIFKGFREYYGLFQAREILKSEKQSQMAEKLRLREQVAARLFKFLSFEAELKSFAEGQMALEKRVSELKSRVKTGRSKRSDVLSAEANLESLKAQRRIFEAQRDVEAQNLIFLTGLEGPLKAPAFTPSKSPISVESLIGMATSHPRVLAESHKLEAAKDNRMMSFGEHLPTADLSGNYYLKRTGTFQDVEWDLRFDAKLPIFQGWVSINRVREAQAKERQALMEFQRAQRETALQIQTDVTNYNARLAELGSLEKAVELSKSAYKEQSSQYDLGLVSNLDVLSSLGTYYETKRSFDRSLNELSFLEEKLRLLKEVVQ